MALLFMILDSRSIAQHTVTLKGKVIVPVQLREQVDLTMDVGDTSCVRVQLYGRGRFRIETLTTEHYVLRFEQKGSVTKTVRIDTHNAERKAGGKQRVIEFDVRMESVEPVIPTKYARPVGGVSFHHSNGRLMVDHDRDKVIVREE